MELGALLTSFALIFVAELGDKTLYMVIVLASRNRAWPVLLGSWAAFAAQGIIAVALGSLVGRLPAHYVRWGTAAVFLTFGLLLLFKREPADEEGSTDPARPWTAILKTFTLIFAAEWGDATQIGSATLVARFNAPLSVFVGATLGLWAGAAIAIFIGRTVGRRIPTRILRRLAGILFCGFALLVALRG